MPVEVPGSDNFHATITCPTDGDAVAGASPTAMGTDLADRTINLKNRVDATSSYCDVEITGTSVSVGSNLTLTLVSESGGFSVASNEIDIPANGEYEVALRFHASNTSAANPSFVSAVVQRDGSTIGTALQYRWSADTAQAVSAVLPGRVYSFTSGQKVRVRPAVATSSTNVAATSYITIRRIS